MADFRKWFMVIAVVLLAAAAANAQTQIANIPCFTSAQVPVIRNGGQTEYIGEVDLNCDATQVKTVPSILVQFTFSVDTTVTNSTVPGDTLGPLTMAGLAVQDTVAPQAILSTYQGRVGNNYQNVNNTLRFPHVVLPMGTTFTVRIFNVRVAALALSSAFAGTQLFGIVAANTENPIGYNVGITNQPAEGILVAVVQDTYSFAVTDCKGAVATAALQFQQCQDYLLEGTTGVGTQGIGGVNGVQVFGVKFTELQQTAFKNIVQEDGATVPQDGTGICDTGHEGLGYEAVIDDTAGPLGVPDCTPNAWVSNGTRLLAQFQVNPNLVGKLHIYVSQFQTASSTGATAQLATTTSAYGWGLDDYSTSNAVSCSNNSVGGAKPNYWVKLPDSATETASWEIINDNLGGLDNITFAWTIVYSENQLPPTPVGSTSSAAVLLTGNIAPISTQTTPAPVALGVEPVVRFALPFQNGAVSVTITDCVTNLLFPYVTNIAGFNTGIAISNTSLDTAWNLNPVPAVVDSTFGTAAKPQPFNTVPQSGPCDLYLFGSSIPQNMAGAGTSVQAIASGATPIVAAGQTFADTLTNIFNLNKAPTVITGYVIARCSFQFGHGYAYLVDPTGRPQGYLALIIPDRSVLNGFAGFGPFFESTPVRVAVPFSNSILDEQGEILAP